VLLLALAYPAFRGGRRSDEDHSNEATNKLPLLLVILAGVGIGILGGLVGIGGTVALVPLMVMGYGLRTKTAISTSLAVVLCVAIVGAVGYIATGFRDLLSLPPLIVGSMVGAWIGVRLRDLIPEAMIQRSFAILMVVIAAQFLSSAAGIF
jgi:uncharacterized membrane protein YfcA